MNIIESKIEEFGKVITQIGAGLERAGQLIVEIVDGHPQGKKLLLERYPQLAPSTLSQLESVGRRQMHPSLALTANPGLMRLRNLPYSDQERYLSEPLEVLVEADDDCDVLLVKVTDLSAEQAKQVFAADHVRGHGAQRAYLQDLKQKAALVKSAEVLESPYRFHGKKVELRANMMFTAADLMDLARKIM